VLVGVAAPLAAQEPPRDTAVVLPPIEVSVTRGTALLSRLPFALTTTGGGPTADLGLSLSAALATVPGIVIQARGNASRDESLAIRGFGARAAFGVRGVRVLLDGIPQTMPDGQSQLTLVNLRRVGSIEVMRGTGSALYGNATGGVISLRSDRRTPAAPEGTARVAAGGFGLVSAEAGLRVPLGAAAADVAVQHDRATGYRAQSRYEVWRAHLGLRGVLGPVGNVGWVADVAAYPVAQDPGALTAEEATADPSQANPRYVELDAGKDVWQAQMGLTVDRPVGAGGRVEAAVFLARRDLINRLPFAHIDLERWAYGGRLEASVPLGGLQATLVVGGDVQQMRDDRVNRTPDAATVTRDQLETVREVGPFVQLRYAPVERVALLLGARFDAVTFGVTDRLPADGDESGSRTLSAPSGTVGVSVGLSRTLVGWARLGTAFETPTTTELANRPAGGGGFNPDLEPQHAVEGELGFRLTAGAVQAGAALFHAGVRDELVAFEVPSDPGRVYFRNAGRARHRGVELDARYQGPAGVWAAAAYTLSDLRFVDYATDAARFDGNRIPGVPMHLGRLATGIALGPLFLEGEARAASRVFADDGNSAAADAWWVADLQAAAAIAIGPWALRPVVGVENVFDRRYVAAVAVNAAAGRYYEPAARRTAYVAVSVRAARSR
jgi:iron complex outermembrane receptor protein